MRKMVGRLSRKNGAVLSVLVCWLLRSDFRWCYRRIGPPRSAVAGRIPSRGLVVDVEILWRVGPQMGLWC